MTPPNASPPPNVPGGPTPSRTPLLVAAGCGAALLVGLIFLALGLWISRRQSGEPQAAAPAPAVVSPTVVSPAPAGPPAPVAGTPPVGTTPVAPAAAGGPPRAVEAEAWDISTSVNTTSAPRLILKASALGVDTDRMAPLEIAINGQKVGTFRDLREKQPGDWGNPTTNPLDVTSFAHPGENTLHVAWLTPCQQPEIVLGYAAAGGHYGASAQMKLLTDPDTAQPAARDMTFVLPDPANPSQATPTPGTGSQDNQTVVWARGVPQVTIYVNGHKVGDFQDRIYLDVSRMVHPGQNTLRYTLPDTRPDHFCEVKVAYARHKDAFGDLVKVDTVASRGAGPTGRTVSFLVPSP